MARRSAIGTFKPCRQQDLPPSWTRRGSLPPAPRRLLRPHHGPAHMRGAYLWPRMAPLQEDI